MKTRPFSVFFDDLDLQTVEVDGFDEVVTGEPGFAPSLEIPDIHIQPDGLGQVKFPAQSRQAVEDLGSPAVLTVITDDMVLQQVVLFEYFTP